MSYFSPRLPHLLTRADLAQLLTPTYTAANGVDDDEALERMQKAMARPVLVEELYQSLSTALVAARGERTEDQVMDKLSKGVQKRLGKMKPAPATQALLALMVRFNVEIGHAPEPLRATLETEKGRALLRVGFREVGEFLAQQLLK